MGSFLRGLLLGVGFSWLIAPMRGQEMRHLISERFQQLRGSLPQAAQLGQVAQQTSHSASKIEDEAKNITQQDRSQVKQTVSVAGDAAERASSEMRQTGQEAVTPMGQTTTSAPRSTHNANDPATIVLLRSIPGVDTETQRKLEAEGIHTTQELLEHTSTKEGRADVAHKIGLSTHAFRILVTRADLMQLQGVGGDVATLLEEVGVTGCKDLQQRNPEHLHAKITEVQQSRKLVADTPNLEQVTQWIAEAMAVVGSSEE